MTSQIDFLYDIYLDIKGMTIERVTDLLDNDLTYQTKVENVNIGSSLHVFLTNPLNKGKVIDVVIYYSTNADQTAVSWVPAENTLGKHMDYMYTQCQPAHCRSLVPIQDSPSMKFTYDIETKTSRSFVTYVSGNKTRETFTGGKRNTFFSMQIPIPGYLIAIVSGDLIE